MKSLQSRRLFMPEDLSAHSGASNLFGPVSSSERQTWSLLTNFEAEIARKDNR